VKTDEGMMQDLMLTAGSPLSFLCLLLLRPQLGPLSRPLKGQVDLLFLLLLLLLYLVSFQSK
jgi:hypothetical protein